VYEALAVAESSFCVVILSDEMTDLVVLSWKEFTEVLVAVSDDTSTGAGCIIVLGVYEALAVDGPPQSTP
jgi:hypothetical protein